MRELNIEEVKQIELEILIAFRDFCDQNKLRYSIDFGTLIGAIRHKGFIPWDDDIDVIMPRNDYEKFLKIYHGDKYKLMHHKNTKDYFYPFAKLVASDTLLIEPKTRKKFNMGIYIDIFPADGVPNSEQERIALYNQVFVLKNKLSKRIIGYAKSKNLIRTLMKYIVVTAYTFSNYKKITQEIEDLASKIPYGSTSYYGTLIWPDTYKDAGKISNFDHLIDLEFENEYFKGFAAYDEVLSDMYGDYMKFPPEKERFLKHQFKAYKLDEK